MKLRVVLDTNVILSALLFRNGRLSWIRHAWQTEMLTPVVCRETINELLRVLTYPKFKLNTEDRHATKQFRIIRISNSSYHQAYA